MQWGLIIQQIVSSLENYYDCYSNQLFIEKRYNLLSNREGDELTAELMTLLQNIHFDKNSTQQNKERLKRNAFPSGTIRNGQSVNSARVALSGNFLLMMKFRYNDQNLSTPQYQYLQEGTLTAKARSCFCTIFSLIFSLKDLILKSDIARQFCHN